MDERGLEEVEPDASSARPDLGFSFTSGESSLSAMDLDIQADDALLIQEVSIVPLGLDVKGRTLLDIVIQEDRAEFRECLEHVQTNGGMARIRLRLAMGDSPYVLLGVAQLSGQYPLGVSGLFCDGELSMYGPDVDESSLYRELFERLPVSVYFKDHEAAFIRANISHVRGLGYSHPRDVIGKTDEMIFGHKDDSPLRRGDEDVIESGLPIVGMTEVEHYPDGSSKVVHASRYPIRNRQGQIVGTMGFSHDVTQSARVVEALARSEQRYALAAQASRDGIWDYSIESETFELSKRMCELVGVPITAEPVPATEIFDGLSGENVERLRDAFRSLFHGTAESIEELICVDVGDRQNVWIEIVGTALKEDGRVVRLIGSAADVTDDREREAELEHLARHDPLTGLVNRRVLVEKVDDAINSATPATLLALDLDYFKVINDSLGHQAGDAVLCQIAERLADVTEDGVLGRLGGDEFAVLLTNKDEQETERIADRMTATVREELNVSGLDLFTTASIGVVHLTDQYTDAHQAFRDADIALYSAKANGKARHEVFEHGLRLAADEELDRQLVVRRAVQKNSFFLMYQPVFDTKTRQISGVEALLRLTQEDGTIQTPAGFLPYLEQTELIQEVGEWVIDEAFGELASWKSSGLIDGEFRLGLNVSRKQFQGIGLGDYILKAAKRHGLSGDEIVLEVTETAVADDHELVASTLDTLRSHGINIALDDFGTGQSSLAVLHDLPVDVLKIDKSFIDRIDEEGGEPVTEAALWLAKSMGLETIAEGVENETQFRWLVANGCDLIQGFLLGEPMLGYEVLELLTRLRTIIQPAPEVREDDDPASQAWAALEVVSTSRPTLAEWAERVSGRKVA